MAHSFRRYLLQQLESCLDGAVSIFERITGTEAVQFQLKDSIKFHMYISHPPCNESSFLFRQ